MKKLLLFPLLLFFSASLFGQEDTVAVFSRGNFTFNLQNGITHGKAEIAFGELRPDPRTGHIFHGNLNYTYNFLRNAGATIGIGTGAFPLIYEMYQLDLGRWRYFDDVDYNPFVSIRGELNYRHNLTPRYLLNGYGGASFFSLIPFLISHGAHSSNQPDALYMMRFQYEEGWKPVAHLGTGLSRVLPNRDLLTFRLDYHYSFQDFYTGRYLIMPGTPEVSAGNFSNNGNHLNFGLGYTFSRQERAERHAQTLNDGFDKDAKKQYRAEKRLIPENTTMFGFSFGTTAPVNKSDDENGILLTSSLVMLMPNVFLEHNLKNNFYAEGNLGFQEYYSTTKIDGMFGTSGSNAFYGFHFNAGGGKRFVGKRNNYNYLNISAGAGITLIDERKGYAGTSGFFSISPPDTLINYTSEDFIIRSFSPNIYLGASKDFRLAKNFYLVLLYRYNQGLLRLYEQRAEYTSSRTTGPQNAIISINGSYHTFQLGMKFNLGNLAEKSEMKNLRGFEKGTLILSAMPGMIWYQNKVDAKNPYFDGNFKYTMEAFTPTIGAEYYLDSKNFLDGRLNYHRLHHWEMGFNILNLSLGGGRRIALPHGLELFNVQAGVSLSSIIGAMGSGYYSESINFRTNYLDVYSKTYNPSTRSGEIYRYSIDGNDTISTSLTTYQSSANLIPALYLGLTKDFRLSNNLSTGVSAFRNFGLHTFYTEEEVSYGNDFAGERKDSMNGTGTQVLLNLKYRVR